MPTARQKFELLKAYHEAGHAVVARLLEIPVNRVTVFPTDDANQAIAEAHSAAYLSRNEDAAGQIIGLEKDAKVCLAGPYAQHHYRPAQGQTVDDFPEEWVSDIANAQSLVATSWMIRQGISLDRGASLSDGQAAEAQRLWRPLAAEAEALVAENWRAIERVAKALITHRELTGDDIDDLIARSSSGRENVVCHGETPPVKPDPPKLFKGLALPDNCRDVTAERIGEKFALIGPPMRRIEPSSTSPEGWLPPCQPSASRSCVLCPA